MCHWLIKTRVMGVKKKVTLFFARGGIHTIKERKAIREGHPATAFKHSLQGRGYGLITLTAGAVVIPTVTAGCIAAGIATSDTVGEIIMVSIISVPLAALMLGVLMPVIVISGTGQMLLPETDFLRMKKLKEQLRKAGVKECDLVD